MKRVNTRVMRAIRNTRGRFFGLYTTQGEAMNAQLMGETDKYVQVYDRNAGENRKLAKTSICGVRLAQQNFGKVF
jgi:hypothetical protein|tara:strand:+ start:532 stop:756 length:225 start_codon:yes stop_codon:yes gene_type:complete